MRSHKKALSFQTQGFSYNYVKELIIKSSHYLVYEEMVLHP